LRMGTSVFVARVGRTRSYPPAHLRTSVRRLARKTRRTRMGVVDLGGFRYSGMSGIGESLYEH